jgi:hypothetical protein
MAESGWKIITPFAIFSAAHEVAHVMQFISLRLYHQYIQVFGAFLLQQLTFQRKANLLLQQIPQVYALNVMGLQEKSMLIYCFQ